MCGWSPTGRIGGDVYIEIEMDASVDRRADDVFTVLGVRPLPHYGGESGFLLMRL